MLNKQNLSIHQFTSKSSIRPELEGIYISPKETVATDSIVLARIQIPKVNISDFPVIKKGKKPLEKFKPFILPKKEAEKILKLIPADPVLPILENVALMKRGKDVVEFAITDLQGISCLESNTIEGNFPNYKDLLPKKGRQIKVVLNPQLLKKVVNFVNEFTDGAIPIVELEIPVEKNAPIRFNCERGTGDDKQKAEIILMPIKSE